MIRGVSLALPVFLLLQLFVADAGAALRGKGGSGGLKPAADAHRGVQGNVDAVGAGDVRLPEPVAEAGELAGEGPESAVVATLPPDASAARPPDAGAARLPDAAVRGRTVLLVGMTPASIREEVERTVHALGLNLVVLDKAENRGESAQAVSDADFLAAPVDEREPSVMKRNVELVGRVARTRRIDAVVSFSRRLVNLASLIRERIGAAGVPTKAVLTAEDKAETRRALNAHPSQFVAFSEPKSAEQAADAYTSLGAGAFFLKSKLGENSSFVEEIYSKDGAASTYAKLDGELRKFLTQNRERSTIYKRHPGILMERLLERLPGTFEASAEVVREGGKTVFAILSDTHGIGPRGNLAGGSLVFPSQQAPGVQAAMLASVNHALDVVGYEAGNARVDVIMTPDGSRIIEINPSMGAAHVWKAVKILTGVSLVEHAVRAIFGLRLPPGRAPSVVMDYRFAASRYTGTIERIEGEEEARAMPGVKHLKLLAGVGDSVVAPDPEGNSFDEYIEIMAVGATVEEARARAIAALGRLQYHVRVDGAGPDAPPAVQTGDYLQLPAAKEAPPPAAEPKADLPSSIFSPRVLGFFSGYVLIQVAVEFLGLVVPQMANPITQGLLPVAAIAAASYVCYAIGSFLGGRLVARFGIGPIYRSALILRVAIAAALAVSFYLDPTMLSTSFLILLGLLYSLELFVHSIGRAAENTLRVAWFQKNTVASANFVTFRDFVEYGMVFFALATGPLIKAFGFGSVVYSVPVLFALAAAVAFFMRLPAGTAEKANPVAGFRALWSTPGLFRPFFGLLLLGNFFYPLYHVTATAFGVLVAAGDVGQLALVVSMLIGSYGAGGIIGAVVMAWMSRRIDRRTAGIQDEDEREAKKLDLMIGNTPSILRWAAASILGAWLFVSPVDLFGAAWPVFWVYPALFAIGLTAQLVSVHLDTIMTARIPRSLKANIVGASRSVPYLTYAANYLLLGVAFHFLQAGTFVLLGLYCTLTAAGYLWLSKAGRI